MASKIPPLTPGSTPLEQILFQCKFTTKRKRELPQTAYAFNLQLHVKKRDTAELLVLYDIFIFLG